MIIWRGLQPKVMASLLVSVAAQRAARQAQLAERSKHPGTVTDPTESASPLATRAPTPVRSP